MKLGVIFILTFAAMGTRAANVYDGGIGLANATSKIGETQNLGGALAAPDGSYFLFEWSRPFDWTPRDKGLPPNVAQRPQTFIYRVDTTLPAPSVELLFQPSAAGSYYLGALSPDGIYVCIYALERDGNKVKTGVVKVDGSGSPQIQWFDLQPDLLHLEESPIWTSNTTISYPHDVVAGEWVVADVLTGKTRISSAHSPDIVEKQVPQEVLPWGLSKEFRLLAKASVGDLAVYGLNSRFELKVIYEKSGRLKTILERQKAAPIVIESPEQEFHSEKRPWKAQDSALYRRFPNSGQGQEENPGTVVSPNGEHFFFKITQADLERDCVWEELYVFDFHEILRQLSAQPRNCLEPPKPIGVLRRPGYAAGRWAIDKVVWSPDSRSIVFSGWDSGANSSSLFRWEISTGGVTKYVGSENVASAPLLFGPTIIYATVKASSKQLSASECYPTAQPPRRPSGEIYYGSFKTKPELRESIIEQFGIFENQPPIRLYRQTQPYNAYWPSPDGRRVIVVEPTEHIRESWLNYNGVFSEPVIERPAAELLPQFVAVDMVTGQRVPLLDAPAGVMTKFSPPTLNGETIYGEPSLLGADLKFNVLWFSDGLRAVIANTALPLTGIGDRTEFERKRSTAFVVDVNILSGRWEPIVAVNTPDRSITMISWFVQDQELLIEERMLAGATQKRIYNLIKKEWRSFNGNASEKAKLTSASVGILKFDVQIAMKQSAEQPPTLIAKSGPNSIPLLPHDPTFDFVAPSKWKRIGWWEADGKEYCGYLAIPERGKPPFPLVVEGYSFHERLFSPDGPATTGFAAQALLGRGFAVLQYDHPGPGSHGIEHERESITPRLETAIESAAADGSIDTQRIGLLSFSRGGFHVFYAVTHSCRFPIKAALVADSMTLGFASYLADSMGAGIPLSNFHQFLGSDFWSGKGRWLEADPIFNVDRVCAPVLFTYNHIDGHTNKESNWDAFQVMGAFQTAKKPIDVVFFPNGTHLLSRPRQIIKSVELSVDWMSFWIQGYEDPAPEKTAQYERWRLLRKQQDEVLKTPPPPKGKWVFQPDAVQPEWHPPGESAPPPDKNSGTGSDQRSEPTKEPKKVPEPASTGKN